MKIIKIFLILIIIVTLGVGAYYGANMYMENRALKEVNKIIEQEHLEGLVDYEGVEANVFSRSITLKKVKFALQNKITSQDVGIMEFDKVILNGDWNKNYTLKLKDIKFINLNPQSPKELMNKKILKADCADFDIEKSGKIMTKFDGSIRNIRIDRRLFLLKEQDKEKIKLFNTVMKVNNPINIVMSMMANPSKKTLNIKKYKIDFVNNFGISYKMYVKNIDIIGLDMVAKQLQKNKNSFMVIANAMSKVMQIKPVMFELEFINNGMLDRVLEYQAKQAHMTKDKFIEEELKKVERNPVYGLYKPVKNLLTSKSKKLKITIRNKDMLSVGDLMSSSKNISDLMDRLYIEFSN